MDDQTKEINKLTEHLIQVKYKQYQEYLKNLDDEYLAFEFNDRMGCDPVDYYSNANNWDNEPMWMETLLDSMANLLYDDPYMDPINEEYKSKGKF
jgi:hypothetical protein